MPRDYAKKRPAKRTTRKKRKSHAALWFFTLVLFVAFTFGLVYLGKHHVSKHRVKPIAKHVTPAKPTTNVTPKSTPTTKFDFYTLLPQKNKDTIAPEYEIEIATVKEYADADRIKAEVSLLGFDVNIDSFKNNEEQLYKISIGPYDNKDTAINDQNRLKQNGLKSTIKKMK